MDDILGFSGSDEKRCNLFRTPVTDKIFIASEDPLMKLSGFHLVL